MKSWIGLPNWNAGINSTSGTTPRGRIVIGLQRRKGGLNISVTNLIA
jgi:hypothetical protein